ncbi:MAG TPA: hypothetical protein VGF67_24490 [Ktedonobacteraceae bacterium]|jgi:hypothetical protein
MEETMSVERRKAEQSQASVRLLQALTAAALHLVDRAIAGNSRRQEPEGSGFSRFAAHFTLK